MTDKKISFVVLFLDKKPQKMVTTENFDLFLEKSPLHWWDEAKIAIVPSNDFKTINLKNIEKYI